MTREIIRAAHTLRRLGHRRHRLGVCIVCALCDHSQKMFCPECGLADC